MTPETLLNEVKDRDSFIAFVQALADERDAAQETERENPARHLVDGALNWKNADIPSYLHACLDYFEDRPFAKPETIPSWQMFAKFLYFGKIIE